MNDPLLGPRIKLQRANHHLVELERTEREFFDDNPCRIVFDPDSQPGHKLVKIVLDARPPEIMHVLAGELIYQLRSALDQTAVVLARLSAAPINVKKVKFPCGDRLSDFKGQCRSYKIDKLDSDFIKEIIRLRPYDGANETLRAVFRMANIDKHMELIAIGAGGSVRGANNFSVRRGFKGFIVSRPGDLNEGIVISDLRPDGEFVPNHPDAKIHIAGQITLGEVAPYQRRPLVPFLGAMLEEVDRAHARLEGLLIARGDIKPRRTSTVSYWPETDWFKRGA